MEYKSGRADPLTDKKPLKFSAFISYSHADSDAVGRLHSRIEAYRLPKGVGAFEGQDRRLGKVFRDREDLSAAQNLSDAVTGALDHSKVLLVACSPEAKLSRWVNQEIAYFRQHHPERPILAMILSGEPEDVFPDALTQGGVEPLAADLRKQGDGAKLGFLKVVAGIAGVPLDALIQRESQRQLRRVIAVTGVVGALAVIMGIMTMFAIQARSEAEFQRNEADGLIAYMMEDLRAELKGVGRLDVMEGVNERALQYYVNHKDLSDLPPEALEQRAVILHAIGEDSELAGDLARARERFAEAHRTTEALLEREPQNPERVYAHAQSEYWLGLAPWLERDLDAAEEPWRGYLQLSERLQKLDPDSARSLMELGYSNGNMCELRVAQVRLDEALDHCEMAVEHMRAALAQKPDDRGTKLSLANRHGWYADTLLRAARPDMAVEQRRLEAKLIDELLGSDPENAFYRLRSVSPALGEAEIYSAQEQHDDAIAVIVPALAMLAQLRQVDRDNGEVALVQVRALLLKANALRQSGGEWTRDYGAAERIAADFKDTDMSVKIQEKFDIFHGGK